MSQLTYKDMKVSVGPLGGDFRVQIRKLDRKFTHEELAELVYPIFDAIEREQCNGK